MNTKDLLLATGCIALAASSTQAATSYLFESSFAPLDAIAGTGVSTQWSGTDGASAPSVDGVTIEGKNGASDDFAYYIDNSSNWQRFSFSPGALDTGSSMTFDHYIAVDNSHSAAIEHDWADVWIYDGSTTLWLDLSDAGQNKVEDTWQTFSVAFDTSMPWYTQSGTSAASYADPSGSGSIATQGQIDAIIQSSSLVIGLGVESFSGASLIDELTAVDNINIVPELSTSALLAGFASTSLLIRRKRK